MDHQRYCGYVNDLGLYVRAIRKPLKGFKHCRVFRKEHSADVWSRDWMGLEWFCGEGNGTPLQYSCLENRMDGGAWKAAVHGVAEGRTRLSDFPFTFHFLALEKEMATHSSVLFLPGESQGREAWWAAVYGDAQSRTRLKWLSSSSSSRVILRKQVITVVQERCCSLGWGR